MGVSPNSSFYHVLHLQGPRDQQYGHQGVVTTDLVPAHMGLPS